MIFERHAGSVFAPSSPCVFSLHRDRSFGCAHYQPLFAFELGYLVGVHEPSPEKVSHKRDPRSDNQRSGSLPLKPT